MTVPSGLFTTIVTQLPGIITALKQNATVPGQPPPTEAQVIAALRQACDDTLAKDDAILASHPAEPNG